MAKQRHQRAAKDTSARPTVDIEQAFQRALTRFVKRAAPRERDEAIGDWSRRMTRELGEVSQAFQRVRKSASDNGRGWDWNLLQVLDWKGGDIEDNERQFLAVERACMTDPLSKALAEILPAKATSKAQADAVQRARKAETAERKKRLRALSEAYAAAQPHLEWAIRRSGQLGSSLAAVNVGFADLIDRAIEDHDAALIGRIHGNRRGVDHVKMAAVLVLAELHDFTGATWKADVATFIGEANDRLRPRPCPEFAAEPAHGKIHTAMSRCGL